MPWSTVDNVFIPICLKDKFHLLLLVVSFNDHAILVDDSIRSATHDAYIKKEVNKSAELISTYIAKSQFYKNRVSAANLQAKYKSDTEHDPFDIIHVKNLLQLHEESV